MGKKKQKWLSVYIVTDPDGAERKVQRILDAKALDELVMAIATCPGGKQYNVKMMKKIS